MKDDFSARKVVNLSEHPAVTGIDNSVDGILREIAERRADPSNGITHNATGIFAIVVHADTENFDFTFYCGGMRTSTCVALLEAAKAKLVKHLIGDVEP